MSDDLGLPEPELDDNMVQTLTDILTSGDAMATATAFVQIAQLLGIYYHNLIDEGFPSSAALELTKQFQQNMFDRE